MMLALAFILGFAAYLGAHGHTGAAYLLLGFVVCYPVFRFLAWSIKEFFLGLLLGFGPDLGRVPVAYFDRHRMRAQGGFGNVAAEGSGNETLDCFMGAFGHGFWNWIPFRVPRWRDPFQR